MAFVRNKLRMRTVIAYWCLLGRMHQVVGVGNRVRRWLVPRQGRGREK